ncbi:MAG: hypothetical protein ABII09_06375 [Planctomycetota bacterium]
MNACVRWSKECLLKGRRLDEISDTGDEIDGFVASYIIDQGKGK